MDEATCACCAECGTEPHREYWLNKDCCGLFCGMVTNGLLAFAEYAMLHAVIWPWFGDSAGGMLHAAAFTTVVVLAMASHLRAMTTDPGAVPPNAVPAGFEPGDQGKQYRICVKCDSFKPPRTHHCSICERCVVKMDHHCPWVNNCVGLGNHKFFLLFLFYVFLASAYALTMLSARLVHCAGRTPSRRRQRLRGRGLVPSDALDLAGVVADAAAATMAPVSANATTYPECQPTVGSSVMMLLLTVEAILFGLFTMCMMCDQWSVVLTSATKIDRLKGDDAGKSDKRTMCDNLNEVFGGEPRFSVFWLLPTEVRFVRPQQVYGYRVHQETELAAWPEEVALAPGDGGAAAAGASSMEQV